MKQPDDRSSERALMVSQIAERGVRDKRVLAAMAGVARHLFIPEDLRGCNAYGDHPCSIGRGQTISQPYIVAYMTERMNVKHGHKVLEIGTGSGYQAAILAELGCRVYSVEIVPQLADHAVKALASTGYGPDIVHILVGDGHRGWPEHSPFDIIIVTCAPDEIPQALVAQLADGGRLILPLGTGVQRLVILRKQRGKVETEEDLPVRFVPMIHGR